MSSKKRYIPIIALGALLLTLLAVLPVAAAGEVEFIVPGDINENNTGSLTDTTPDAQTWARQGGQVGILIDDSDTDAAVKRVLLPFIDTEPVGDGEIVANSNVIKLEAGAEDLGSSDGLQTVERDDLIMVGNETLRKVTKVEVDDVDNDSDNVDGNGDWVGPTTIDDDIVTITLDRAYHSMAAITSTEIHRIKRAYSDSDDSDYGAFDGDGYKTLAAGLRFNSGSVTLNARTAPWNDTQITLDRDILDSGIGSHIVDGNNPVADYDDLIRNATDSGLSLRLKSAAARGVRNDDVLMVRLDNLDSGATITNALGTLAAGQTMAGMSITRTPLDVNDNGTFRVAADLTTNAADRNTFVLFWAKEENDTGSDVTVRSQSHQTAETLVLRETGPTSGKFAARVELVPEQLEVPWNDLRDGTGQNANNYEDDDGGAVKAKDPVDLNSSADSPASAYDGYKVEFPTLPTGGRPTDGTVLVKVKMVADFGQVIPRLPVKPGDVVSVRHPDDSGTIRVETRGSLFSNFSPAHNSAARDDRPELSVQVVDSDSGLKEADIDIIYTVNDGAVFELEPDESGYTDPVAGGFSVRVRVDGDRVPDSGNNVIKWWVKAKDKAGNITYSDRLSRVDDDADDCTVVNRDDDAAVVAENSKCQPYIIMVDNVDPTMLRAETGRHWDPGLETGDSDDKTEYRTDAEKASTTSILVVFDEWLDAATVQANDFEVNDATPSQADVENVTVRDDSRAFFASAQEYIDAGNTIPSSVEPDERDAYAARRINPDSYDGNPDIEGDDVQDEGEKRGYVFLTVNELTPNATPKVELVDNVEDIAGNRKGTGTIRSATDRIAPTLSVSIQGGDRPVTKKTVTLTVTSDENIGEPVVSYRSVGQYSEGDGDPYTLIGDIQTDAEIDFKSSKEYEVEITPRGIDGLYTILVEADDSAGNNTGRIGDFDNPVDVDDDTDAILFELDSTIRKPDFDPARAGVNDTFETDDPNGFIRIDYGIEGREYRCYNSQEATTGSRFVECNYPEVTNADGDVLTPARNGEDVDTHGRVTVRTATLDGDDISGDLNPNTDGNIFQYHLAGMAVGEYKLEITVEDEAGNTNPAPHKATIKIIERKPYKLKLNPGWNLVSLPGQPADTDINAVIPADHPIDAVRGYDPMVPGAWLIAEEGGDGTFSGTLETIEAGTAYWIKSSSFQDLEVNIPKPTPGSLTLLPTIQISQGWNLVPILDVDGDFELDEQTADDNYFSGLTTGSVAAIYTYNTVTNSWMSVAEEGVALGKGYWVYATKPGVIVP